jgi:hypothetical protein
MGRLVAENGQVRLLREGLNTVAAATALLLGGAHDLPGPTGHTAGDLRLSRRGWARPRERLAVRRTRVVDKLEEPSWPLSKK